MKKNMQMLCKFLMQTVAFLLLSVAAIAQNVVSGKVTDAKDGSPLPGVTVTAKGTNTSTQTLIDGSFKMTAPSGTSTLVFTSVGFGTQEMAIAGQSLTVSLVAIGKDLNEVIVVAYGTRKKSDLTGSVSAVSSKDFQKGAIASAEQLLQGKVAGLQITSGGGSAGGGSKIRIRGGASLNASNDPLVVIDGVPVEGNDISGSGNLLNMINPNDIESMSILKDASATALYGSRASNGVLIITTKKGNKGAVKYNFNSQLSNGMVAKTANVLSADQVRAIVTADATATGNNTYKNLLGSANTDWQKEIYQNAVGNDNNISATGNIGDKNVSLPFRISMGYLNQAGILKTNQFDRVSSSLNLSPKFFQDHLAINLNAKYAHTSNRFANEGAIGSTASFDPTQPIYSGKAIYGGYYEWLQADGKPIDLSNRNPLALLNLRDNRSGLNRVIANVQADYKFHCFPDLHLLANVGMDYTRGSGTDLIDSSAATNYQTKGRVANYEQTKKNMLADVSLFYNKDLKSIKSKIDLLVGHSYQDFLTEVSNFAAFGQDGIQIPGSSPTFPSDKPEYRLESYFGRVNISVNDKYLLTGSIRRDASSKFSAANREGYFPAGAAAWKLKQEFFKNSKIVSDLKLRFGWGITGQQDGIGYYTYLPVYGQSNSTAQYQFGNTYYSFLRPSAYDANIKWETTTTTNLGLDFAFLNNRISGSVELYNKKTKDLLSVIPVAPGSNFDIALLTNVGNVENKGVEFTLNTVPIRNTQLTWELGFNVTYNESTITNLLKQPDPTFKGIDVSVISGGTGNNIGKFAVGYSPYSFFVYKQVYDKVSGNPIDGLYEDINRDGTVDDNDRYLYKKPSPDFLLGFNTQVAFKQWTIGLAAHGMVDNYLYNNYQSNNGVLRAIKNPLSYIGNGSSSYLDTKFINNRYLSDYYIENASFIRLDNINIGYSVGKVIHNKASLRLSLSAQNVLVISNYKRLDPENASSSGVDNTIYPRPRVISLGANLDF
jgi:TonB-dependent starch-binding outer membrane protein SusC